MSKGSVNKVILVGRLGADPDIKNTNAGLKIANISLATTSSIKNGDQWEDKTEWHRVVLFDKLAETVERFLKKGSQIYIEGRLQTDKWQDKEGNDRWTTKIIANEMQMLGGKSDNGVNTQQKNATSIPSTQMMVSSDIDGDAPF